MRDKNFVFVRMSFICIIRLIMTWRDTISSSAVYGDLMESVDEVVIVVDT